MHDLSNDDVFIKEVKIILDGLEKQGVSSKRYHFPRTFRATDLLKDSNSGRVIVGAADTLIELGHPVTASVCLGMITKRDNLVCGLLLEKISKELQELPKGRHSFACLVLAKVT